MKEETYTVRCICGTEIPKRIVFDDEGEQAEEESVTCPNCDRDY